MPNATAPSSVRIRMYNVGFGDCFLLDFKYAKINRYVLVDYGSTAAPKNGPPNYMRLVADDIKTECGGKLHAVIATHRHRDHISGFSTDGSGGGTGKIIASLDPDYVIQPWTEDPNTKPSAVTATSSSFTKGKADEKRLAGQFLGTLEDMHRVAASVLLASKDSKLAGGETREQLRFLGDDNLKNLSAVQNLMAMGRNGKAYYVNAGMKLNILPGVKITVLGPPDLKQSDTIRKERAKDKDEFWQFQQFRSFWASQNFALSDPARPGGSTGNLFPKHRRTSAPPPNFRWFIRQSRQIHGDQMLELVRDLDSVMNNTSVILLLEIGARKLLFPGDAQIENWAFALNHPEWKKLLKDVNLYKVGHHGSLNATPKSLWALFSHKGDEHTHDRLETICSTKAGKHGSVKTGTEVPRRTLVEELEKDSQFTTTEKTKKSSIFEDVIVKI